MTFDKNKFITVVKRHSYFCDSANWKLFRKRMLATKKVDIKTINRFLKYIDKHSFAVKDYRETKEKQKTINLPKITGRKYSRDIGYLKLPGFFTLNNRQYRENYKSIIRILKKLKNKKYLILDISENTGGNMYPWLAALAPLYDTNCVGYFYKYKKTKDRWLIKKDGVYCGNKRWFKEINKDKFSFKKIVILISPRTSSSGEAIAISFSGQNNVKILGQRTANFTTGNEEYKNGDVSVWLSTCLMQNRGQKSYINGVKPDIFTKTPIKKAIEYLNKRGGLNASRPSPK